MIDHKWTSEGKQERYLQEEVWLYLEFQVASLGGKLVSCYAWLAFGFERQTVHLADTEDNTLVLHATHAKTLFQHKFQVIFAEIDSLFSGELYPEDSRHPDYNFLALHFGDYNKYSESVCIFTWCFPEMF